VDASNRSISVIPPQTDPNKKEKYNVFSGQKLIESQTHAWSTNEKEAYAVIDVLKKIRDWILLSQVSIYFRSQSFSTSHGISAKESSFNTLGFIVA
jgi:hypothetical protein